MASASSAPNTLLRTTPSRSKAKRKSSETQQSVGESGNKQCKHQVSRDTFMKWQHSYEVEYPSLTWLRVDIEADNQVNNVWCSVC